LVSMKTGSWTCLAISTTPGLKRSTWPT